MGATIINPGVMDTGMQETIRQAKFEDRERFVELHRTGRLPDPAAVARQILADHL
jgi:NAD(P)-dependent dehydrogenase (short-subunit alcohol dehydrogenase family)